jgi:hypothetical protein
LLADYQKALDSEVSIGETKITIDPLGKPTKLLSGQSAVKMDALWKETLKKINDLKARPVNEREKAIQSIRLVDSSNITYIDQVGTPYNNQSTLERYQTGKNIYTVDITTNQIVDIFLLDDKNFNQEAVYSQSQLEKMARDFVNKTGKGINIDQLPLQSSNKEGIVFFFRWEDSSKTINGGGSPFVQVSLSRSGEMVNYTNTFPLSSVLLSSSSSGIKLASPLAAFSQIYANGGVYWSGLVGFPANTQSNAGYCYIYGCSPTNFYYATVTTGNSNKIGRWSPNQYSANEVAAAFIPNTHGTTQQACYILYYNFISNTTSKCIQQLPYNNTFVYITSQSLYNIGRIELGNGNDRSNTAEIAWDEMWVKTP